MINITKEANNLNNDNTSSKEIPSLKEYSSIKIKNGLSFLETKIDQGKKKMILQKKIYSINNNIDSLSKTIGHEIMYQIINNEPISITSDKRNEIQKLFNEKKYLMEEIKNG